MRKGEIALLLKNKFDTGGKDQYLWVHAECVFKLAKLVESGLETETIFLMRKHKQQHRVLSVAEKVTKGQIHLKLCNTMDAIEQRRTCGFTRDVGLHFQDESKGNSDFSKEMTLRLIHGD